MTSIWPVKGRVQKVIDYARNPEKVTEGAKVEVAALHAIDGVMEYAADDIKTEERAYVTCIGCREDTAAEQYLETKRYWSAATGTDKLSGRVCYHGYQSFAKDEVTAEIAHEIGVKLATRLWGDRFEVLIATHCNTGHYHNHFVLNSVSWRDGRKFYNSPADYKAMREESDRLCLEYQLSVIEEPSGRGRNYGEYLAEKNGMPTSRGFIREDIDRAIRASMTEREFFLQLSNMGYEIKTHGERGQPLKHPAIRPNGAKGFFRLHKLGEGYSLPEIQERILKTRRREVPFPEEEAETARSLRREYRPSGKIRGLKALYIRYCFELKIIARHPASVKRVSFLMREDLIRLDRLDQQTRLLSENNIETLEDLNHYREELSGRLKSLENLRKNLRNELKRVIRALEPEEEKRVKERIAETSAEMKKIRKTLALCDGIEERAVRMEEDIAAIEREQEKTTGKEREHEQLFRGRGGAGRADVLRRQ